MPTFGGATGATVAAGTHHDNLQHSTANISPSTAWFSRRVQQRRESIHGIARTSRCTARTAAAVSAGRQHQLTSFFNTTTSNTSRHDGCASGGSSARSCPRCPLQLDGTAVLHATSSSPCEAACVCAVCGSDGHLEHWCFIAHGVPVRVKMRADKVVELVRLHGLYAQGAFDWRNTPTSLEWMLRLRAKHAVTADPDPNPNPNPDPDPDGMHGHGSLASANGCDCEVCELHGHGGEAWANHR